jgi:hypothetical protein
MRHAAHTGAVLLLLSVLVLPVAGCSSTAGEWLSSLGLGISAAEKETARAQSTLDEFFSAWAAQDERSIEALLDERRRGMDWQFEKLDRVEFGTPEEAPKEITDYRKKGVGRVTGAEKEDIRCFRADVTFYYTEGVGMGAAPAGEPQGWLWFLERDESGAWHVTQWGY